MEYEVETFQRDLGKSVHTAGSELGLLHLTVHDDVLELRTFNQFRR